MFGGGGLNPRKMKQMMEQMGIDVEELDADEVVIRSGDEELVFDDAQVTRMDAQGQQTYQIIGEPERRAAGAGDAGGSDGGNGGTQEEGGDAADGIPDDDVQIVAGRAEVSADEAREALRETGGDLAAAIDRLT